MSNTTQSEVLALAKGDQKRLEQLAALAGRSPQSMLKFVLCDGFDAVEEDIRETLATERDIELHGTIPHAKPHCAYNESHLRYIWRIDHAYNHLAPAARYTRFAARC